MAASSSRLLKLTLNSYFLRSCRLASRLLAPTASRCHPGPLHSLRFCSALPAAVDVAADPAEAAASAGHPWPEWGDFLDKLRVKGYFEQGALSSGVTSGEGAAGDGDAAVVAASEDAAATASGNTAVAPKDIYRFSIYRFRDENRVKNACLKFARNRYDLLSSLPEHDIQTIVMSGCPNKNRKPVNSAKRLRQFVDVKEEDACSICKFKASCDNAYNTPTREAEVKTVDVVRILLSFAMDKNLSGENSVIESVQESAKKLLSRLIELSDTKIDEPVPKPAVQASRKARGSDGKGRETTAVEMKKGDWLCTKTSTGDITSLRLITAVKTPYLPDGRFDLESYDSLVNMQIEGGSEGVIVGGTTGEGHLMSWDEHIMLIGHTVNCFGSRIKVIGNTGSNSTREAVHATEQGFAVGMHAALHINPYYGKISTDELISHFEAVLPMGPTIIYNVPSRSGQDIPPEVIEALSGYSNLAGVKECVGHERVKCYTDKGITIWSGNDDECHDSRWKYGATGVISVASNLVPGLMRRLMYEGGNALLNEKLLPLMKWLFCQPNPIALNTALAQLGVARPVFRLPYVPLPLEKRIEFVRIVEAIGRGNFVGQKDARVLDDDDFALISRYW